MMKSRHQKHVNKLHNRHSTKEASLNMVSLMDIFTILVFFLLVSAADSEVLPSPKKIELPKSTSKLIPKENIIIMVNNKTLTLQGKTVGNVRNILASKQPVIQPLLNKLSAMTRSKGRKKVAPRRGVTIMGDKTISYELLKKIMLTCATARYTNISLAVNQKSEGKG